MINLYFLPLQDCSIKDNQSGSASDAVAPDTITSGASTPDPFELDSNITGHEANQMDQEVTIKLQQLTGCVSDCSTREEEDDRVTDNESDVQMDVKRQGSEDRDEEDGQLWRMEVDLDEGRTEDEEDIEDEEVKDKLHRLVAQAKLTYFTSTDDEVDKVGLSEGEWEGDKDKVREEEGNEEPKDEKIDSLPYKICQLEKQVRASQFSSTEDELDGLGVMEEETGEDEEDGTNEELAVKVCRLANQVKATEFSSTEDELDRAGREGEEAMHEETLWKLQAEKAIQAAQLRDLSCLVSASQFSATEDQLDGADGEDEGVVEGGFGDSVWEEEAAGKKRERRESFADLDVRMFDLMDETEEKRKESSDGKLTTETTFENQTENKTKVKEKKDCGDERVMEETEDERMVTGQVWEEKECLKECKEAKDAEQRHLIASNETRVQQENQPEAKWPDKRKGGERQHDVDERKESQEEWESAPESIDEDEEFDRIISSMLMLTLEDMQGGLINEEDGKMNREPEELETGVKTGRGSKFEDHSVNTQSTNASDEMGSSKSQCRGENVMQESAGEERPGQSVTEMRHAADRNKNEETEKDTDSQDKRNVAEDVLTIKETRDAQHAGREMEDDKEGDGGGKVTCGDAAEGGCETKDMAERFEGTNGGPADHSEQSSTSLHEGPLSPEENQIVSIH